MSSRYASTTCLFCFTILSICFAGDAAELSAQKKSSQNQKLDEKTAQSTNNNEIPADRELPWLKKLGGFQSPLSDFKTKTPYKVSAYLKAAVELQKMDESVRKNLLKRWANSKNRHQNEFTIILAKLLFEAKKGKKFHGPNLGAPHVLGGTESTKITTEPILMVDGIPFLVVRGYSLQGLPEPAAKYLAYCFKECKWSTRNLALKNRKQQKSAFDKIVKSKIWTRKLGSSEIKFLKNQLDDEPVPGAEKIQKIDDKTKKEFFDLVKKSHYEKVKKLLKQYPRLVRQQDDSKRTPLNIAVRYSDLRMVKLLLEYGSNPNIAANDALTPLHLTFDLDIVKVLLDYGADAENINPSGRTVLQEAAHHNKIKLANLIIEETENIDLLTMIYLNKTTAAVRYIQNHQAQAKKDIDSFLVAITKGYLKVVQAFLDADIEVNQAIRWQAGVRAVPTVGDTPLGYAVRNNHYQITELLLKKGANPDNGRVRDFSTPFYYAIYKNRMKMAKLLLKYGATINDCRNYDDEAALHCAVKERRLSVVKFLLKQGADIDLETRSRQTALEFALGDEELLEYLLSKKAKINFLTAVGLGRLDLVKKVIDKNPKLLHRKSTDDILSPVLQAAKFNQIKVMDYFLSKGIDVNRKEETEDIQDTDWKRSTPLHVAAFYSQTDMIEFLLKKGANIEAKNNVGNTALLNAVESDSIHSVKSILAVKSLLENGADITARGEYRETVLHISCQTFYSSFDLVKLLVEYKADLNVKNEYGKTPLMQFVEFSESIAKYLIQHGAEADLNSACVLGMKDRVEELLRQNPKLVHYRKPDPYHQLDIPFENAIRYGHFEIYKLFLDRRRIIYPLEEDETNPLFLAISVGNKKIVEDLFRIAPNKYRTNREGLTVFLEAVASGQTELVDYFLTKGSDKFKKDPDGLTALHLAAKYGNLKMVKKLIALGLDKNAKTFDNSSLIHFAAGNVNLSETTPMDTKSINANMAVVRFLIEQDVDINAKNANGKTPVGLAIDFLHGEKGVFYITRSGETKVVDNKPVIELLKKHGGKK